MSETTSSPTTFRHSPNKLGRWDRELHSVNRLWLLTGRRLGGIFERRFESCALWGLRFNSQQESDFRIVDRRDHNERLPN
jgi:hypothetical protein